MKVHSFIVKVVMKIVVNQAGLLLAILMILNFDLTFDDVHFNKEILNLLSYLTGAQKVSRLGDHIQVLLRHEGFLMEILKVNLKRNPASFVSHLMVEVK
jgi:hypothetical protein